MRNFLVCLTVTFVSSVVCDPVSQPVYPNAQFVSAQSVPGIAYKQPSGQGYVQQPQVQLLRAQPVVHPVYENRPREGLQHYASQPIHQVVPQGVLPERQVQKVQSGSPYYFQPLQSAVLAAQARDAFAAAQRKEATVNREIQHVAGATQQQPQQYVKELPQQYIREQPQQYVREQPQQYVREQPQQVVREQPLRFIARPVTAQYKVQQAQGNEAQKEEEDLNPNQNYQFGFDVKDDLFTNYQNRKEQRDGNKITGSYSVVDSDGYIRTVQYTADPKEGFKAEVTRQPTDIVVKVPRPDPQFQALHHRQDLQQLQPLQHIQQPQLQQSQQPQQYLQEVPVQRVREPKHQATVAYRYQ